MSLSKKINLRDGENIILTKRQYNLVNWWRYLLAVIFLFLASFYMFQLFSWGWYGYLIYGLTMFIGVYILMRTWFLNHSNLFITTNERVIDIHRAGWFDEVTSAIGYKDIKDISVRKKGLMANVFNYGVLTIHSKTDKFVLDILYVHNPMELQSFLQENQEKFRRSRKLMDTKLIYRGFIKIIPELSDEQLNTVNSLIMDQFEEVEADEDVDDIEEVTDEEPEEELDE